MRRALPVLLVLVLCTWAEAVAQTTRRDPLTTFVFSLKVDGGPGSLSAGASFRSVSGLSTEISVVEYREGGENGITRKVPGVRKYGDITLKRGITGDTSLATWLKLVEDGQIEAARKSASIVVFDTAHREVARWNLVNAWPSKLSVEVDEATGEISETLTIAVELIRRQ